MKKIKKGQVFGKWTALNTVQIKTDSGKIRTKWSVQCECGKISNADGYDLNKGKTTQCRKCYGSEPKDLKDKIFGKWTVLRIGKKNNRKTHWICKCLCGKEENVCSASLLKGVSTQCINCYQKTMPIHGYTCGNNKHPLYNIWKTMIARCENPKNSGYYNYGARGIKVCDEWHDLDVFARDMGKRPKSYSIDRIDYNGNYRPENCKWSSHKEQGRNKRNNRIIEYNGLKKCLSEWAEYLNIKDDTLYHFLTRNTFDIAVKHYKMKVI